MRSYKFPYDILRFRQSMTYNSDLSSFRAHNALKTTQWDSLEKALIVFILPPSPSDTRERVHRRLDLIFADPKVYWTAIVGWSVFHHHKCYEISVRIAYTLGLDQECLRETSGCGRKKKSESSQMVVCFSVHLINKFSEASNLIALECMSHLAYPAA